MDPYLVDRLGRDSFTDLAGNAHDAPSSHGLFVLAATTRIRRVRARVRWCVAGEERWAERKGSTAGRPMVGTEKELGEELVGARSSSPGRDS